MDEIPIYIKPIISALRPCKNLYLMVKSPVTSPFLSKISRNRSQVMRKHDKTNPPDTTISKSWSNLVIPSYAQTDKSNWYFPKWSIPACSWRPHLWRFHRWKTRCQPQVYFQPLAFGAAVYIVTGWITLPTLGLVRAPGGWWGRWGMMCDLLVSHSRHSSSTPKKWKD